MIDDEDIDPNLYDPPTEDLGFYTPEPEINDILQNLDSYKEYKHNN